MRDGLQAPLDLVVLEQRRQRRRHVLGVPDPRQLLRRNGATFGCLPAPDAGGAATISAAAINARNMRDIICENEPRWTRCCPPPSATAFEAIAAIVSAALYLIVGMRALARAPKDVRTRVFLATALASAAPYSVTALLWARGVGGGLHAAGRSPPWACR